MWKEEKSNTVWTEKEKLNTYLIICLEKKK